MSVIRKGGRIVAITLAALAGFIAVIFVVGLILSPGKPLPFKGADGKPLPGSVSEKIWVDINGMRQGMFIKGRDVNNPVLLFLHGGMGMPEYFLTKSYPSGLEDYFTVCWWDRRGAGLSAGPDTPWETVTIEQEVKDTLAVAEYLKTRFNKDKVYLMAHSGGTVIGLQAAARAPGLFHAYIAAAQMTWQLESENLSAKYMAARYREIGNTRMADRLEQANVTMSVPLPMAYMKLRDPAMHGLGVGTTRDMKSVITGVFLASWLHPEYTLREKLAIWRGKFTCDRLLWDSVISTDLRKLVPSLSLPVYFFHGAFDYTVSYPMAKAYLQTLSAPVKGFYTFGDSAHSPMFEEPEKMRRIFAEDIFAGKTLLADRE